MYGHQFSRQAFKLICSIVWMGLILNTVLAGYCKAEAYARVQNNRDPAARIEEQLPEQGKAQPTSLPPVNTGPVLMVTNTNMEENGSYWDPLLLIANPGPDGISYAEAIHAVGADNGLHETITFDPSLRGAIIDTSLGHNSAVTADGFTLDGDLDDDGEPDITLDGNNAAGNGVWLWGASHVLIEGIYFRNFSWGGIRMTNNVEETGHNFFEDIVIRNNRFSGIGHKGVIEINIENEDYSAVKDIKIIGNTILDDSLGINIEGSWGGTSFNEISHVFIISNTITGGIFIYAGGGFQNGNSHNIIRDVMISDNQISGDPINLAGSNQGNSYNNTLQNVVITDNQIDASPIAIKVLGATENAAGAHDNLVENITITDNNLTGGGLFITGGQAGYSYNNVLSGVEIDRNLIASSGANGVYMVAGDNGGHHNRIENTIILNNLIAYSNGAGVLIAGKDSYSNYNAIQDVALTNLTLVNNGIGTDWAGGLNIDSKSEGNTITGVTIFNTLMWDNNFDDGIRGSEEPESVAYSILNDPRFTGSNGNTYADPEFMDPPSWDYSLQASSPGIDSGDPSAVEIGSLDVEQMLRLWDGDQDTIAIVDRGAWEYGAIRPQEIDVQGNLYSIRNGDTVPGYWDNTDFGIASLSGETVEHTFALRNTGDLTLTLISEPRIAISGAHTADFSVTVQPQSPIDAGGSTTFTVSFDPNEEGLREAIVSIPNDDLDEDPYTFAIKGMGVIVIEQRNIYFPIIVR